MNKGQLDIARPFHRNNQHDALGGPVPKRKRLSRVFLRQPVNHFQVRIPAPFDDPAAELRFLVWVVRRNNGQPDPRIAARVLGLERILPPHLNAVSEVIPTDRSRFRLCG
jgi:hypothetical protein